jgi:hypothetical protein
VIVWCHIGRYGQTGLVLVEKHLEYYISIVNALAIEHKLDVGCHGEHLEVDPAFGIERLQVVHLAAIAVKV